MVFYRRADGSFEPAEFGTTCTAVTVVSIPAPGAAGRKLVITANAGDSDACLVRTGPGRAEDRNGAGGAHAGGCGDALLRRCVALLVSNADILRIFVSVSHHSLVLCSRYCSVAFPTTSPLPHSTASAKSETLNRDPKYGSHP